MWPLYIAKFKIVKMFWNFLIHSGALHLPGWHNDVMWPCAAYLCSSLHLSTASHWCVLAGAGVGGAEPEELSAGERYLTQPTGGVWGPHGAVLRHPQHQEEAQLRRQHTLHRRGERCLAPGSTFIHWQLPLFDYGGNPPTLSHFFYTVPALWGAVHAPHRAKGDWQSAVWQEARGGPVHHPLPGRVPPPAPEPGERIRRGGSAGWGGSQRRSSRTRGWGQWLSDKLRGVEEGEVEVMQSIMSVAQWPLFSNHYYSWAVIKSIPYKMTGKFPINVIESALAQPSSRLLFYLYISRQLGDSKTCFWVQTLNTIIYIFWCLRWMYQRRWNVVWPPLQK